jgi:hypothetical protein
LELSFIRRRGGDKQRELKMENLRQNAIVNICRKAFIKGVANIKLYPNGIIPEELETTAKQLGMGYQKISNHEVRLFRYRRPQG